MKRLLILLMLASGAVHAAQAEEASYCPSIFIETDSDGMAVKIELQDEYGYRTSNTPDGMTQNSVQMWYMRKIMAVRPTVYMNGVWIDGSPCET